MTIQDKRLNKNAKEQQDLIRQLDNKEITNNEYLIKRKELKNNAQIIINELINKELNNIKEKNIEENKMVEDKKVETKKEEIKVGKKVSTTSNASLIGKALEMKTVKKIEDVIAKVKEWKPEAEEKKVKGMTKTIINECKKGKGRWKAYTWDEENFLLVKKEE